MKPLTLMTVREDFKSLEPGKKRPSTQYCIQIDEENAEDRSTINEPGFQEGDGASYVHTGTHGENVMKKTHITTGMRRRGEACSDPPPPPNCVDLCKQPW